MRKHSLLGVEMLESRDTPSVFGTPWPDGQHLTISFAPDGTMIDGTPSNLQQLISSLGPQEEDAILQAFQTWTVDTNLNLGLVSDDGTAFGNGRDLQGDPRFGDIRIAGRPLASDVIAITSPYMPFDNSSGEVIVNTAANFGPGGYDLATVLMHEAGHAFGIGDNSDTASVMYTYYQGTETALAPEDMTAIQSLYGVRKADLYEGKNGNGTPATATPLATGTPITADLTTTSDVDVYKFSTGLVASGFTVQLDAAGLSLLTAKVDVLNSQGKVIASTSTLDPANNDLTLSVNASSLFGGTYYVRVYSAKNNPFGVGSYQLTVSQQSLQSGVTGIVGSLLNVVDNTLLTATNLIGKGVVAGPSMEYHEEASLSSSTDVDYYRIAVPISSSGAPANLLVTMWGMGGAALDPWLQVDNALGKPLAAQVFTADDNATMLQVTGLQPGGIYYIRASSTAGAKGNYDLSADITPNAISVPLLGAGSLTPAAPANTGGFTLPITSQVHLVLEDTGKTGSATLSVIASDGSTVASLTAGANLARSLDLVLPAGTYQVVVQSSTSATLSYRIGMAVMTDPVGAQPTDPTTTPQPTPAPQPAPPPPPPPDPSSSTSSSGSGTTSSSTTDNGTGTTSSTDPSSSSTTDPSSGSTTTSPSSQSSAPTTTWWGSPSSSSSAQTY